jgi:hypothetical protein
MHTTTTPVVSVSGTATPALQPIARGLVWTLCCANFAVALCIVFGGTWDLSYHETFVVDTFWSPPHVLIYFGMLATLLISLGASGYLVVDALRSGRGTAVLALRPLITLPLLANLGFLAGGPLDAAWHAMFGRDVLSAWSPPHAILSLFLNLTAIGAAALAHWLLAARPSSGLIGPGTHHQRLLLRFIEGIALGCATVTLYGMVGEWEIGASPFPWVMRHFWLALPISVLVATFMFSLTETLLDGAPRWLMPTTLIVMAAVQKIPSIVTHVVFGYKDGFTFKTPAVVAVLVFVLLAQLGARWPQWMRWASFGVSYLAIALLVRPLGLLTTLGWFEFLAPALTLPLLAVAAGALGSGLGRLIDRLAGQPATNL